MLMKLTPECEKAACKSLVKSTQDVEKQRSIAHRCTSSPLLSDYLDSILCISFSEQLDNFFPSQLFRVL